MEVIAGLIVGILILTCVALIAKRADDKPMRQRLGPENPRWWEVGSSLTGRWGSENDKDKNDD